ncbi:nuclear transport factor 2 family protein [Sphingosinicella terrae]|uniref:nuclear transport factor 2 family protein n=1 Tax=Sphingosinicella terrae TaxID=2172047 RepID=UPI0013B44A9E|nr:nuclear transport factor 2 family protein [Sphingosinicella terrae]
MTQASEELQAIERAFWFGDAGHYRARLTPDCMMVFPQIGVLDRETLIAGIEKGPRWSHLDISGWRCDQPAEGVAVIAYRAVAGREGMAEPYRAWCGSLYVRIEEGWLMAFHQQTPD